MTAIVVSLLVLLIDVIKTFLNFISDSLLKVCAPNLDVFLEIFPDITSFNTLIEVLSIIISGGLFIYSLYAAMLTKESESPLKLVIRGVFAPGLIFMIKDLLDIVLNLLNGIYSKIIGTPLTIGSINLAGTSGILSEIASHFLEFIILFAVGFQLLALIMEVAERYITMCVLYFLSPLASACTSIATMAKSFFSFLQMFFIELLMLFLNVFFLGTFFKSFSNSLENVTKLSIGKDSTDTTTALIIVVLFHLAFLKVAREIDSHIKGMGFSAAQTGKGLWGEIVAGLTATKAIANVGKMAAGAIKSTKDDLATARTILPKGGNTTTGAVAKNATNSVAPNSTLSNKLNGMHSNSSSKQATKTATKALNNPSASVGGEVAKTSAAALFPELSGAGLMGASFAGGVLASSIKNADGSTTKANYSKENTKGSVPVTGSDGNTYYRTAENENGGPVFGYGAPVGQSAPLSSRFSNDDIQKMGFGENATLTNNGDGSLSVTGEDGSRLGTLFSPGAYKNSQEGASSIQTSDGDTWGIYTSGNFSPSLDSDSLMNFVSESSALGSVDPITSIDTSNYASTGTLTATRRSGMTDTINSSNASSFFGGYGIDEVVSASGTSWSDYENATNKIVSSVDTSTASQGYSTVTNTDGSQTRVYDSSRWSTRDRYADYFSQGNVSFFTEEGTKKVSVENGTKKETNVFSKARKRK